MEARNGGFTCRRGSEKHDLELQSLRLKLSEAEQLRERLGDELLLRISDVESSQVGLEGRQLAAREALEGLRDEALQKLETLAAVSQGATLTLEDHEARLCAVVACEQRGRAEAQEELRSLRLRLEEELGKQNVAIEEVCRCCCGALERFL